MGGAQLSISQMYTYAKSQDDSGDPMDLNATRLLQHPSLGSTVDEAVTIQGHQIRFMTVDFALSASLIRNQLLKIVE